MKTWLIQIKREFWEHQTLFFIIPLSLAALIILAGTYVVTLRASLNSMAGNALFGHVYFLEGKNNTGNAATPPGDGSAATEYIIDFTKGTLVRAEDTDTDNSETNNRRQMVTLALYGFHSFIMLITSFVLVFYQINCLYGDRKDRSILFWKSMPVSEVRNIATKLIVSLLAVPVLATVISWGMQLCYLGLSTIFVYRVGSSPWEVVWGQTNLLHLFTQELILIIWAAAWWLPLSAWLLFSSALGKRSPFLVATVPIVVVIIMDNLLSGSWHVGNLLLTHFKTVLIQGANLVGEESNAGLTPGTINIFYDTPAMIMGFVIAGILLPATAWLRNHRFEI